LPAISQRCLGAVLRMSHRVQLRPRRDLLFAYAGTSTLITGLYAQVREPAHGYFVEDHRLVSRAALWAEGRDVDVFSAGPAGSDGVLACAKLRSDDDLLDDAVYVPLHWRLSEGLGLELQLANRSPHRRVDLRFGLELAADFADLNDVINEEQREIAGVEASWDEAKQQLRFEWQEPRLDRAVLVRINGDAPASWSASGMRSPGWPKAFSHPARCSTSIAFPRSSAASHAMRHTRTRAFTPGRTPRRRGRRA